MQVSNSNLQLWFGIALLVFVVGLEAIILWRIFTNMIPLNKLISEPNGDASMSRLQLLIFTFVIAISFFYITVKKGDGFPAIPPEVLTLLGISTSTYLVSKGIQTASPNGNTPPALVIAPNAALVPPASLAPIVFTVGVPQMTPNGAAPANLQVDWGLDSPSTGHLEPNGTSVTYTPAPPPPGGSLANTTITLRARSAGYTDGTAIIKYQ